MHKCQVGAGGEAAAAAGPLATTYNCTEQDKKGEGKREAEERRERG